MDILSKTFLVNIINKKNVNIIFEHAAAVSRSSVHIPFVYLESSIYFFNLDLV